MYFFDDVEEEHNDKDVDDASQLTSKFENCSLINWNLEEREMTPEEKEIQEFCEKVQDTLQHNEKGYVSPDILAGHIFEDHQTDAHRLVRELGFRSFQDFLRSDQMKSYIDIIDDEPCTTYHCPLAKEKQNKTLVHEQKQESFLNLQESNKIFKRNTRGMNHEAYEDQILLNRYYSRRGLKNPQGDKLSNSESTQKREQSTGMRGGRPLPVRRPTPPTDPKLLNFMNSGPRWILRRK